MVNSIRNRDPFELVCFECGVIRKDDPTAVSPASKGSSDSSAGGAAVDMLK